MKYDNMNEIARFGLLINTMDGGGDAGQAFPRTDAEDLGCGLRFIPGEVIMARRRGERVEFVQRCSPCCWYWQFQDGARTYYWERGAWQQIAEANGVELERDKYGTLNGIAGACPICGNSHIGGGHIKASEV